MSEVPADWLDQAARREADEQARASELGTNTTTPAGPPKPAEPVDESAGRRGGHPMSTEPRAAADRAAKRDAIRRDHLAWAERASLVADRSIKCAGSDWWSPRHADVDGGCRNDGTTCLCECHDAKGGSDG